MAGGVSSLNVSAAGAAVLFEAARQRRAASNSPATLVQKAAPRSGAPRSGAPHSGRGAQSKAQKGLGS
jgi:hypothetical protein